MESYVYVSGPMTGMKDNNVHAFNAAAKKLRKRGYLVVNPAELDGVEACMTWEACLRRDLRFLVQSCDKIALLPGWKKSRGANLEVDVAKRLGFEIHSVTYFLKRKVKNAKA